MSSGTVESFNELMNQFIDELVLTFPDVKTFKKYQSSFILVKKTQPKMALKEFYASVSPYGEKIMKKDDTFFTEDAENIDFVNDLKIKDIWTPDLSVNTKNAIWQYMQTLYILATTIQSLPQETLTAIEDIAKSFNPDNLGSLMDVIGKMKS